MTGTAGKLRIKSFAGAPFGVEIASLDPGYISQEDRSQIWDAYRQGGGLICFSFDRLLESEELHELTGVFGENEFAPGLIDGIGKKAEDEQRQRTIEEQVAEIRARGDDPYIAHIGNVDPQTLETDSVDAKFFGEWEWHTDMSFLPVPPTFSLLLAREVPDEGGDTGFCNQVMAAEQLSTALRQRLLGLRLKHDSTYASSGVLRPGMSAPKSPIEAEGHVHPLVRRVPRTGEEALFLGRRTNGYIVGLALEESEQLLDELWAHATQEKFYYRHRWQVGQVVVWDNRTLMHARHPLDQSKRRFMWRTQTKGEEVIPVDS